MAAGWFSPNIAGEDQEVAAVEAPELLPELRLVASGTWSLFSVVVSEVEADDDWDDTDSLLPIDVSSVARPEPPPSPDTV